MAVQRNTSGARTARGAGTGANGPSGGPSQNNRSGKPRKRRISKKQQAIYRRRRIVAGTVLAHDLEDHLTTIAFPGGQLQLVSTRQRPVGQAVRLRVQARDVSLTLSPQTGTSILNAVPAQVVALRGDSPGQIMVALEAGTTRLLARITQRSARTLCLTPGMHVVAQVKGIALLD